MCWGLNSMPSIFIRKMYGFMQSHITSNILNYKTFRFMQDYNSNYLKSSPIVISFITIQSKFTNYENSVGHYQL